jgi:hypothetical protein
VLGTKNIKVRSRPWYQAAVAHALVWLPSNNIVSFQLIRLMVMSHNSHLQTTHEMSDSKSKINCNTSQAP